MLKDKSARRFQFPIESGQVLHFARAIGDPDPIFKDPDYATLAPGGRVVPPPTFLIAAHHFDTDCPLRPAPGEAAPGTGIIPLDGPPVLSTRPRGLHAEETFTFHRHPRIGEILTVDVRNGDVRTKEGSEGTLEFRDILWEYRDSTGALIATACWTSVFVHTRAQAATTAPQKPAQASKPAEAPPQPTPLPAKPLRAGELKVGDRWSARVVETLRMTHLITYAGASGDLVALHYDERIVKAMGHPGLFGHGMLTMGLSGRLLTAVAGTANLRRYSARMTAVVFIGDTLTATLSVERVHPATASGVPVDFCLKAVNQHGRNVLNATASATLPS